MGSPANKTKILILGGGFGGVAAAQGLSKVYKRDSSVEITLVNRDNYFVFVPLLASAAAGSVETMHVVAPIRRLIPNVRFRAEEIMDVNLDAKTVTTASPVTGREHKLVYDHIVVALGNVINLETLPGVAQHGRTIKTLGDALDIRNHVLAMLEAADIETDPAARREMLTFVVAGGGFSGVEMVGEMNDLIHEAARNYPSISEDQIKVVLLHSRERILPEMGPDIADYALNELRKRGVEVRLNIRLAGATPHEALLADGRNIPTRTLIVAVGNAPPPVVERMEAEKKRGKIVVDEYMRVPGRGGVWALGDIAIVPNGAAKDGSPSPPTAQYAIRQGKALAKNIAAVMGGGSPKPFAFGGLGLLCVVGHGAGVGELPLGIKTKGILGWFLWRSVYWSKVPSLGRKIQIGAGWIMDVFLKRDIAQINLSKSRTVGRAHYEAGEYIFRQGDPGTHFYMVSSGEVEVVRERSSGRHEVLATLGAGEYFGETSLLTKGRRNASVRCASPTDVVTIGRDDFAALAGAWSQLAGSLRATSDERTDAAPLTGFVPIPGASAVSEEWRSVMAVRMRRDDGVEIEVERELTTFGRDAENHVVVNDPRVSRRHALVQRSGEEVWIEDLDASNGVWLNENRVNERAPIKNGDTIRIGRTSFVFQIEGASATSIIGTPEPPEPPARNPERTSREGTPKKGFVTGMIENLDSPGRPETPKEPPRRNPEGISKRGFMTGMIEGLDAIPSEGKLSEGHSREGVSSAKKEGSVTGMIHALDAKPEGNEPPSPRPESPAPEKSEAPEAGRPEEKRPRPENMNFMSPREPPKKDSESGMVRGRDAPPPENEEPEKERPVFLTRRVGESPKKEPKDEQPEVRGSEPKEEGSEAGVSRNPDTPPEKKKPAFYLGRRPEKPEGESKEDVPEARPSADEPKPERSSMSVSRNLAPANPNQAHEGPGVGARGMRPGDASPASANLGDVSVRGESPANVNPANENPGDANPGDANPSNVNPSNANPSNANPAHESPGDASPGNEKPGNVKPSNASSENVSPRGVSPASVNPEGASPSNANPGNESPANVSPSNENPASASSRRVNPSGNPANANPSNENPGGASSVGRESKKRSSESDVAPPREGSVTGMIRNLDAPARERLERAAGMPESREAVSGASLRLGGRSFDIGGRGRHILGRDPAADVPVEDSRVSWRHAAVEREGETYVVEDIGSRNGTWLNEGRIGGRAALADGDVIRVGAAQFVFRDGSGKAPSRGSSSKEGSITGMIRGLDDPRR